MELQAYTIIHIDEQNKNITIQFEFTDASLNMETTIHYGVTHYQGYDEKLIEKEIVDEEGNTQIVQEAMQVPVMKRKTLFSLDAKEQFDADVRAYAAAYLRGKQQEQVSIHPSITDLLNKKQQ